MGSRACKDTDLTYLDQIGLMYVTDYGYAAYPEAWDKSMYNQGYNQEDIIKNNWMYMGLHEWTISRPSSNGNTAFVINSIGYTNTSSLLTFYLDYSTKIKSGDGSKTNPFRLSWN